jgi:DNA-binding response OmpR family regulator
MSYKILIIEDEADIREALAETLSNNHYEVFTATNGIEGLEQGTAHQPDVVLLDIIMPKMDGHETLRRLRQTEWGLKAKVIMLTSMDDVNNISASYAKSIDGYIIKAHHSLREIVQKIQMVVHTE